jgi:rhodanese-related sulfurtransferase
MIGRKSNMSEGNYAGDVSPREAFEILAGDEAAVLIDVRTPAEWEWVGLPDLRPVGRSPLLVAWKLWPGGVQNTEFVGQVKEAGVASEAPVLLLCRSGQRSRDAAIALTAAGFQRCYNISDGFEGQKDVDGHRGTNSGWKHEGLPWVQG